MSAQTIEMFNSIDVLSKTIDQRQCRFPEEHLDDWEWPYSFSSCLTRLRINLELKMCNCTLHTSPSKCKCRLHSPPDWRRIHLWFLWPSRSDKQWYCDYRGLLCVRNGKTLISNYPFHLSSLEIHLSPPQRIYQIKWRNCSTIMRRLAYSRASKWK